MNFVQRERTPQEKFTRLEKAKRSRVCFEKHDRFLCSDNYKMPYLFIYVFCNILKFKAKKTILKFGC